MTALLTLLATCIPAGALWAAVGRRRTAPVPTVTDPGHEACRVLTAPQPLPTGRHRDYAPHR